MISTLDEQLFLSQKVIIKRKYTNEDLLLFNLFRKVTGVPANHVIKLNEFIFFFVPNDEYFSAINYIKTLRRFFKHRKIVIVHLEKILKKFLLSFFPDPYVHDLQLERIDTNNNHILNIFLLTYEERGIAVGKGGEYIKAINEILHNHVTFEEYATYRKYKKNLILRVKTIML